MTRQNNQDNLPASASSDSVRAARKSPANRLAFLALGILLGLAVVALLQFYFPPLSDSLRWQADLVWLQPWRLLTAHFVHLSVTHMLLNAAAFVMVWLLFLNDWRAGDSILMLLTLPLTSLLLLWSSLEWYVGLSAVLHGWFLLGCIRVWSQQRWLALLMAGLLLAKLWLEADTPFAQAEAEMLGGPIAYVSHKLGTLAALFIWFTVFAFTTLWDRVRGTSILKT